MRANIALFLPARNIHSAPKPLHFFFLSFLGALAFILDSPAIAANPPTVLTLDLSRPNSSSDFTVPPGQYTVKLINALPGKSYTFTVFYTQTTVKPLTWTQPDAAQPLNAATAAANPCLPLQNTMTALKGPLTEDLLPPLLALARKQLDPCNNDTITIPAKTFLDSLSFESPVAYDISEDGILEVAVSRLKQPDVSADSDRSWHARFIGPKSSDWFITFGVLSVSNGDKPFNSVSTETVGKFQIVSAQSRSCFTYAGGLFFSWAPNQLLPKVTLGITAGLGFDLSNVQLFVGPAVSLNKNLSLIGGGAFHKVQRLRGEFEPMQTVSTALSTAALNESVYAWDWFFGVSFRFDKNPFGTTPGVKAVPDSKGGANAPPTTPKGDDK
jgi:hypothetical protein